VGSDGRLDDWAVIAPGLIGLVRTSLRSVFRLSPEEGGLHDAKVLMRTLIESCITFAWLAGDPEPRVAEWYAEFEHERLKLHNKITTTLGTRTGYREFIAREFPEGIVDSQGLAIATARAARPATGLLERAVAADTRWGAEVPELDEFPFAGFWTIFFGGYSFSSHTSPLAVSDMVLGVPPLFTVGHPKVPERAEQPYFVALRTSLLTLLVAERVLGYPDSASLRAVSV
jgi:hypothetical protein